MGAASLAQELHVAPEKPISFFVLPQELRTDQCYQGVPSVSVAGTKSAAG